MVKTKKGEQGKRIDAIIKLKNNSAFNTCKAYYCPSRGMMPLYLTIQIEK